MRACINKFLCVILRPSSSIQLKSVLSALANISDEENLILKPIVVADTSVRIFMLYQNDAAFIERGDKILILNGVLFNDCLNFTTHGDIKTFINHYDGQAALLLLDKNQKRICAIRDPFGTRTLYFYLKDNLLAISTDIILLKNLIQKLNMPLSIDMLTIYEFLILNGIETNRTLFMEMKQIRAGEYIIFEWSNWKEASSHYYSPLKEVDTKTNADFQDLLQTINVGLKHILKTLMQQDFYLIGVPVSGGLDTTIIISLIKNLSMDVKLFPTFVDIGSQQERILTDLVCAKLGLNYISEKYEPMFVKQSYFRLLREAFYCVGVPHTGDASLPYVLLAKNLSKHGVKFALSGDGGDGIFGGYDYYRIYGANLIKHGHVISMIQLVKHVAFSEKKYPFKVFLEILLTFLHDKIPQIQYFTLKRKLAAIISPKWLKRKVFSNILLYLWSISRNNPKSIKDLITHYALSKFPVLGSADVKYHEINGVIVYFPFMTRKMLNVLLRLPDALFFRPYGVRSIQRVLLKVMGFPEQIYLQRKSGFSTTHFVLEDKKMLKGMREELKSNKLLSASLNVKNLNGNSLHNAYNLHVLLNL